MMAQRLARREDAEVQRLRTALEIVRQLLVQGNFIKASFVTREALKSRPFGHNPPVESTRG